MCREAACPVSCDHVPANAATDGVGPLTPGTEAFAASRNSARTPIAESDICVTIRFCGGVITATPATVLSSRTDRNHGWHAAREGLRTMSEQMPRMRLF